MNRIFCALLLALFALSLLCCGGGGGTMPITGGGPTLGTGTPCGTQGGTLCYSMTVNGATRTFALHVPSNFQKNSGALVIVLHGSDGDGVKIEGNTGFSTLADQDGFAVVYPDGLIDSTGETDWAYFFNDFTDDVGFLRQLIGTIQSNVEPDPKKIYVAGFSAGALMAHRLGVQASDLVAAIGSVEGALYSSATPQTVPAALGPVSIIEMHGDQDSVIHYCGDSTDASQEATFNYWAGSSANSCSNLDTTTALCDTEGNITAVVERMPRAARRTPK